MLAQPDALHPVIAAILQGGQAVSAPELFQAQHRLAGLRRQTETVWHEVDLLLLPTTGTAYTLAQVAAEPLALNARLGRYTNFVNPLDLAALAVPAGFHDNGFPHGVTLVGPAWSDRMLALPGPLPRPALVRAANGASLTGEVWALPPHTVAAFLGSIAPPLGLGTVELEHGPALGFIAEAGAEGEDITAFGGWREYLHAAA